MADAQNRICLPEYNTHGFMEQKTASPMVDFKQSSNEQAINQLLYQLWQSEGAIAAGIYSILLF